MYFGNKDYLVSTNPTHGNGKQRLYQFPNGYGASVVKHDHSYGGKSGLWELAVLDTDGALCYNTVITDDVIGHLNDPEVDNILGQIFRLDENGQ
jgi:hypothetical protein|tara:strand:- start:963 stop:1244 length:282 start_codon:yes stop_codon:yes gene_type:complete